ncbi:MAG TPA: DUF423 domain-containing protein [Stellaceae bacterium]|nr:DUF423 domain-containing protein [Stellaceae bacterium]
MMRRLWLLAAGINGLAAVGVGALAQHLWAGDPHRLLLAETGVRYGLPHAAALIALVALPANAGPLFAAAGSALALGVTLFALSLYALAAGWPSWLAAVTPVGGTLMILGWLLLVVCALIGRRIA